MPIFLYYLGKKGDESPPKGKRGKGAKKCVTRAWVCIGCIERMKLRHIIFGGTYYE